MAVACDETGGEVIAKGSWEPQGSIADSQLSRSNRESEDQGRTRHKTDKQTSESNDGGGDGKWMMLPEKDN